MMAQCKECRKVSTGYSGNTVEEQMTGRRELRRLPQEYPRPQPEDDKSQARWVGVRETEGGKGKERADVGVRTKMWRDRESGGWCGTSGASYPVLRRVDFMLMLVQSGNMLIQPTSVY